MKRRYGYGIAAGLIAIGLAATLAAQPPAGGQGQGPGMRGQGQGQGMRGQGMGPGGPGGGPMAALKLTDDQQQKLQTLMQGERETHQATMEEVRGLRKQLHEMIYSAGDADGAVALATKIAAIEAEARIPMQIAAAGILTPDQRKIVIDSGIEFPPGPMGPGAPGGRGGRGGQGMVKK
jgi:Spy/CpxP family protein refolding chaperone